MVGFGQLDLIEVKVAPQEIDGCLPLAESCCNQEENKHECVDFNGDHHPGLLGDRDGHDLEAKRLGLSWTGTNNKSIQGR
jgi:hypothetical protein